MSTFLDAAYVKKVGFRWNHISLIPISHVVSMQLKGLPKVFVKLFAALSLLNSFEKEFDKVRYALVFFILLLVILIDKMNQLLLHYLNLSNGIIKMALLIEFLQFQKLH